MKDDINKPKINKLGAANAAEKKPKGMDNTDKALFATNVATFSALFLYFGFVGILAANPWVLLLCFLVLSASNATKAYRFYNNGKHKKLNPILTAAITLFPIANVLSAGLQASKVLFGMSMISKAALTATITALLPVIGFSFLILVSTMWLLTAWKFCVAAKKAYNATGEERSKALSHLYEEGLMLFTVSGLLAGVTCALFLFGVMHIALPAFVPFIAAGVALVGLALLVKHWTKKTENKPAPKTVQNTSFFRVFKAKQENDGQAANNKHVLNNPDKWVMAV